MQDFGEKYKRKRLFKKFRYGWKDSIKINLRAVGPDLYCCTVHFVESL